MSQSSLAKEIWENAIAILWAQWGVLGLSFDTQTKNNALIDPEALLVFTWSMGRADPRLFSAALNWSVRREQLLDFNRLKYFLKFGDSEIKRIAGAWSAACVAKGSHRWPTPASIR